MTFETIRRVNYTSAPSCLTAGNVARDFERFHLPLARLHNRLLHGPGVLGGLEAEASPDRLGVVVSPGAALDARGRTIILADEGFGLVAETPAPARAPVLVPLPPGAVGTLDLTVAFGEDPSVPVDPANPAGCKQVEPRPRLRLLPRGGADSPGADEVVLAAVEVGPDGKVAAVRPGLRTRSFVAAAGLTIERVGPADFTRHAVAELAPAGDGGLRLAVAPAALHVDGALAVSGQVILGEPGSGQPLDALLGGLRAALAALQGEVDALQEEVSRLKQSLSAPTRTTVWVHGSNVQFFGSETVPPKSLLATGYGAQIELGPQQGVQGSVAVPTPSLVSGRRVRLRRGFLLFWTNPDNGPVRISSVTIEMEIGHALVVAGELQLAGDFKDVSDRNTFTAPPDSPEVRGAIRFVFNCQNTSPVASGHVQLVSVGAEFES